MSQAVTSTNHGEDHIAFTEFWDEVMHDVFGPRKGGAIIFVDAENARKGVGKTGAAVSLARLFSKAFDYELRDDDFTLSGTEYLRRYQEHPDFEQPSVLVLDEFVGAGTGDARRAMSHQNVDLGRAWQLLRKKRVITLATLPDWQQADKRLRKLADYRVWCRERPIGVFQTYKIVVPFSDSNSGNNIRYKGMGYGVEGARRIRFPNLDAHNDQYYRSLTSKKDELIGSDSWDADELGESDEDSGMVDPNDLKRQEAIKYAIRLYRPWDDSAGVSQADVADTLLHEDYSESWVGNRVREWKKGKHRDLVEDPTE